MRIDLACFVLLACTSTAAASAAGGDDLRAAPSPSPSRPQDEGGFSPERGFYIDVHGMWAQLGGDFDGDTFLQGSTDSIAIPDADSGLGLGLAFGHRWREHAVELAFTQTQHDGSIPTFSGGDITYDAVDFNYRYFFRPDERFQPFVQAGFGYALATLEDSSMGASGTGDADLSGLEIGVGGGAEFYVTERLSLGVRALYREAFFDTAEGVDGDSGEIDESVDGGGLALLVGVTFTF